jgi:hypothetical protein
MRMNSKAGPASPQSSVPVLPSYTARHGKEVMKIKVKAPEALNKTLFIAVEELIMH